MRVSFRLFFSPITDISKMNTIDGFPHFFQTRFLSNQTRTRSEWYFHPQSFFKERILSLLSLIL